MADEGVVLTSYDMEGNIERYIKALEDESNYKDSTVILSSLDHTMTKLSKEGRLKAINYIQEETIKGISHANMVFLAGMIECIYNENGISTDKKWFMSDVYKLKSLRDNNVLEYMPEHLKDKMANIFLESSLPEFKWRNMIQDSIFDSY